MFNLYKSYLKERENAEVLARSNGFIVYKHLPESRATYITEVYVQPEARRTGLASELANIVTEIARSQGHTKLIGSVSPSASDSTGSLWLLLKYGFKLQSSADDIIYMSKEI